MICAVETGKSGKNKGNIFRYRKGKERGVKMKPEKRNRVALLLHWAGKNRIWLFLAVFLSFISGLCTMVPYLGIYRLMNAVFSHSCTKELIVREAVMIAVAVILRFALFGLSGVASHKGAYGALYKVRCMVAEHMAKVPLGALNERSTGDIKTVLNEDIEKLELFLAHSLPDLVCYLVRTGRDLSISDACQCAARIYLADPACGGGGCHGDHVSQHR